MGRVYILETLLVRTKDQNLEVIVKSCAAFPVPQVSSIGGGGEFRAHEFGKVNHLTRDDSLPVGVRDFLFGDRRGGHGGDSSKLLTQQFLSSGCLVMIFFHAISTADFLSRADRADGKMTGERESID